MTATNRGPRLGGAEDFYSTPPWCVRALLRTVRLPRGVWLDPCAGDGAIIEAARGTWMAYEIRAEAVARLRMLEGIGGLSWADHVSFLDLPDLAAVPSPPVAVIANPPYSLAREFVERALSIGPVRPVVCMLLRLGFLESQGRCSWLRADMPDVHVLSRRPSFRNGRTDASAYAWFVWHPRKQRKGRVTVIDCGVVP